MVRSFAGDVIDVLAAQYRLDLSPDERDAVRTRCDRIMLHRDRPPALAEVCEPIVRLHAAGLLGRTTAIEAGPWAGPWPDTIGETAT